MKAWQLCATFAAAVAATAATAHAAEPNESFGATTTLGSGVLTVADELSPLLLEFPDTLLGVRNGFGFVYADDDDSSPVGDGRASGLGGVPTNSGSIDFSVTGFTDTGFSGSHSESGPYRVFIDVYDFFDDLVESFSVDRTMLPGVVDDFYYEGDAEWIGGSYDVYIDNTVGGTAADLDFFTYTELPPGAAFTVQTADPLSSNVDTRLGWFDDFGALIEADDDSGANFLSLINGVVPASRKLTFAVTGQGDDDFLGDHIEEGAYELRLTVVVREADFNSSGAVDNADLTAWRGGFGRTTGGTKLQGDADGDRDVDGRDFLVWQRQVSAPVAAAVPEPSGGAGAACVLGALVYCRRCRGGI